MSRVRLMRAPLSGYRLGYPAAMQDARALWRLCRPVMIPWVALIPVVGFFLAHWDRALRLSRGWDLLWLCLAWIALHAGTMWLNAALDRDEGEVLFGEAVEVPASATPAGYAALILTVLLAAMAGWGPGLAALGCVVLAVLYSHPVTAWKGHPVGGPLVNLLGYGLLSPLAGWLVAAVSLTARSAAVLGLIPVMVLGFYFAAQAFQGEEDRARGYRTLVVTHGPVPTLWAARVLIGSSFLGFNLLALLGWLPEVCLVSVAFAFWVDRLLARWIARGDGGSGRWAAGLYQRLVASCVVLMVGVFGHYGLSKLGSGPSAGLATRAGWPLDRLEIREKAIQRAERQAGATSGR